MAFGVLLINTRERVKLDRFLAVIHLPDHWAFVWMEPILFSNLPIWYLTLGCVFRANLSQRNLIIELIILFMCQSQKRRLCLWKTCCKCVVAFLVSDALYKIARDEGILGLWSGSMPSFVLSLNPAVQFMVYEALKRRLQKYARSQARTLFSTQFCLLRLVFCFYWLL